MPEHGRYIYGVIWANEKEGNDRKKGGCEVANSAIKFFGILLFVVGMVFLLSNYALIPETASKAWSSNYAGILETLNKVWPVVLLGIGLKLFLTKKREVSRS